MKELLEVATFATTPKVEILMEEGLKFTEVLENHFLHHECGAAK